MRGMGNMQNIARQMQKMQKEMGKVQETLDQQVFTATAGQVVTVTFTGNKKLQEVKIDPVALDPEDAETVEDLLVVAINDALNQIEETTQKTMGKYTKGMPGF
ncbi:YbaB/EbfC family nucleoid-associated protein [Enterococcus timonensis]|uniref:YbaB/EbfC family nucleoid-associated protein n=1 Tax=Enterococcus timonensis TaxID=1852364 RepID=UPI0008DA2030|nr:YbaB/EbfC family nucleoid-associated protein [Enterococcus timonensis]